MEDPVTWALVQVDNLHFSYPSKARFLNYFDTTWRGKVHMWCVGIQDVPHSR